MDVLRLPKGCDATGATDSVIKFTLDAHFFLCCGRATQLAMDISAFPNIASNFNRMQRRPSIETLLAYEKEVNEGFAKTA